MGARPRARTVIVKGTVGSGLLWRHEVAGSAYFASQLRMRKISRIDVIGDPAQLAPLDLAVLDK